MSTPTFQQATALLPGCLIPCNTSSQTIDDIYHCSSAEVDRFDAEDEECDIHNKTQRRQAERFLLWLKPHISGV